MNADSAMNITGAACLDVLQSTLHAFLDHYMREIGQESLIARLGEMKKKSWFGNYRAFFHQVLQINWEVSGADLNLLEQVILARNDFAHNVDLLSNNAFQTKSHSEKHPLSAFTDKEDVISFYRKRLNVSAESLWQAKTALRQLAEYLESERWEWLKRWKTIPNIGDSADRT